MTINSVLLNSIENELIQTNQPSYKKIIPIKNYSFETKQTLDLLVEKYGGFINRYDDKIIIFIENANQMNTKNTSKTEEQPRYNSLTFDKVNSTINHFHERLSFIEEKVNRMMDTQKKQQNTTSDSLNSYLKYFKEPENKKELQRLVNEILNHHK